MGAHNAQLAVLLDEPSPSRSKVLHSFLRELGFEVSKGTKLLLDRSAELAGGRVVFLGGSHGLPVEGVVPNLGGVVEHRSLFGFDQLFQGLGGIVLEQARSQFLCSDMRIPTCSSCSHKLGGACRSESSTCSR